MALQRGRDMVIKLGSGPSAQLIGGLTETSISMNGTVIDGSTKDTEGWRELVEDAALKSFSIACSGMFKDSTTDDLMRQKAFGQTIDTYTLVFPNGDTIVCDFQITGYSRAGSVEGVETYNYTLESSGIPVFTKASI
ncbi:phage major tail protein, TP901-1 family [Tautonia marina]|uniref:phage major tail protein, TP901-1 family n=1 Tax=Tautonia marina TaxID=2653855 RepID=UPI0012606E15|nr:phage major tail protein, TP901-1 family [Tautonia marina]